MMYVMLCCAVALLINVERGRLFFQFPRCTVKIFTAGFEQPDKCSNAYQFFFNTIEFFAQIKRASITQAENRMPRFNISKNVTSADLAKLNFQMIKIIPHN
jgi:hypothetical protein